MRIVMMTVITVESLVTLAIHMLRKRGSQALTADDSSMYALQSKAPLGRRLSAGKRLPAALRAARDDRCR